MAMKRHAADAAGDVAKQQRGSLACKDPLAQPKPGSMVVLDGGLATHIEALGEDIDHSLWSARCLLSNPKVIRQAHADYYGAGAKVAITASYQAHLGGFRELGLGEAEAAAAVKKSVELAREAAPADGIVAGSVGSYGASLHNGAEYTGEFPGMDEAKLVDWHRPRVKSLIEAKCDILACETIPCLLEARALVTLLSEVQFPAWVTFSCKSGIEVCSGESFKECVAVVGDCEYVVGAGVNCTQPNFVSDLVATCRETLPAEKHVVVYPNSGEALPPLTRPSSPWRRTGRLEGLIASGDVAEPRQPPCERSKMRFVRARELAVSLPSMCFAVAEGCLAQCVRSSRLV
mmetsp:Transcript_66765/g.169251  ORF Transcript_66765/g.169251 Transcript_66765/m.169251 type:complete len:346 (-) Transcript_66765:32-1069(-)